MWVLEQSGLAKAQTMVFTTLIMFQMFNVFNCRDWTASLFSLKKVNYYLIGAVIVSTLLQIGVVYLPIANYLFGTVPLALIDWLIVLGIAVTIIPYIELWKFIERRFLAKAQ
jgi:Ca2+-transporting ATPase